MLIFMALLYKATKEKKKKYQQDQRKSEHRKEGEQCSFVILLINCLGRHE